MSVNWQAAMACVKAALMRRGRTTHEAEDLVQEAFVRLASYEQERTVLVPEAFLMRTALNLSIDAHRSTESHGVQVLLDEEVLVDFAPSAEAVVLARERVARLSECIGRLNEKTRTIFLSHRVDGMSYREIAKQHGVTISTVEKHVAKATFQLTVMMEGW